MSFWQISSGNGPVECELAVALFLKWLVEKYPDIEVLETRAGYNQGTLKSASFRCDNDLSFFCGSILWTCKSPFRPNHKRKNWFINFQGFNEKVMAEFDESKVVFQTMRASGNGGQNVNKVESAVRALYPPDSLSAISQDERSQHMNRKRALDRLKLCFLRLREQAGASDKKEKWSQHNNLRRGDQVASFAGEMFQVKALPKTY